MKFVIATNNRSKLRELSDILSSFGAEAVSLKDAGITSSPDENGKTFEENAMIKAKAACEASGLPAIGDDSGLEVKALSGAPGVFSHRWCEGTDEERLLYLLSRMEGKNDRTARFVSCIACVFPDGRNVTVRGECYGEITEKPEGENGFGYDPVFYSPEFNKTFAQITAEQKNGISHRGKALAKLKAWLEENI